MKDQIPLNHQSTICPQCERRWTELDRSRDTASFDPAQDRWVEFLAELRRNFRYDASFDAILREAVLP